MYEHKHIVMRNMVVQFLLNMHFQIYSTVPLFRIRLILCIGNLIARTHL